MISRALGTTMALWRYGDPTTRAFGWTRTTYRTTEVKSIRQVTLPEWLTGSPAMKHEERLGFARVCSNRTGDDPFAKFVQ